MLALATVGIHGAKPRLKRPMRPPKGRPKKRVPGVAAGNARGKRAATIPVPGMVEAALAAFAHEVRTPLTGILAISDLLATSDLDERERRWVDTIKAGAEHLAGLATAKGLQSSIEISEKIPAFVIGDPVRLRAALENLIDNAAKFTEQGGVGLAVAPIRSAQGK